MKLKRTYLLLSLVLLIVFLTNTIAVSAMNTGFSTEELSEELKTIFVANINLFPLSAEPEKSGFQCFDVNEQGMIAVGKMLSQDKVICVYTSQGEFLYGYTFNCNQSFCVEWDKQNINVYFFRSDVIISLDSDGNILDIKSVQNTMDNNSHRNSLMDSRTRTVGNTTYIIRNDMGVLNWIALSYSQIVTIDSTGTESIIYDVNSMQLKKTIASIILIYLFVCFVVGGIILQFIKLRRDN